MQHAGVTLYLTNDPEKLKDNGKALGSNLLEVSTVIGTKWGRMMIGEEMTNDKEAMKYVVDQLVKIIARVP